MRWKKKEEEKMQVKKEKEEKKRGKKRTLTHVQSQGVPVNSRREPGDPKGRGASPPSWVEYPANLQNLWRLILRKEEKNREGRGRIFPHTYKARAFRLTAGANLGDPKGRGASPLPWVKYPAN